MKKKAETTADVAHNILTDYDEKNHDINEDALEERAQAMFGLIEKWTTPGDFLVIVARFKHVKEVIRAAAFKSTETAYGDLIGEMVSAVLGLYALSEQRMMVHTNKEYHEKVGNDAK